MIDNFCDALFLSSTDTIIGFISKDKHRLDVAKQRKENKQYIKAISSLEYLKNSTRVPAGYKNMIRRSKRTSFVFPNGKSYRLIRDRNHLLLLERLNWAYTTSANRSGEEFDRDFAEERADIVVYPLKTISSQSRIVLLGKKKYRKLR